MLSKKEVCSLVDLTSLNSFDSEKSILSFLDKAIQLKTDGYKVAAVCFYPNFSALALEKLKKTGIKVAVVAGCFPSSQSFLDVKLMECKKALERGVDEIDIVLNLGLFEDERYDEVVEEIKAFKKLMPHKDLKVILETGYLKSDKKIKLASELAIKGGADFIKTSTGKEFPGADLNAVKIMAEVIRDTNTETGLKVSGGVRTYEDALNYISVVSEILGDHFIHPDTFRIGASSLVTNLANG